MENIEKESAAIEFFRKIHLSIFNRDYLADEVLYSTVKQTLLFFFILFAISVGVSGISRTISVNRNAPNAIFSSVGELRFENNMLVSPDTIKQVEAWRLREFSALITGVRIPTEANQPFSLTVGGDSIPNTDDNFMHLGKSAFSTNMTTFIFGDEMQVIEWSRILPDPNLRIDNADFYKKLFLQPVNATTMFFLQSVMLVGRMFFGIIQIWLALFFYMLFFGKRLNAAARFRLLLLTATPYFIITPLSIFAADGVWFATDIALVAALIMTVRSLNKVDAIHGTRKEKA
ncbi:MAG: hypothetical protein FWE23_04650 [Chitinivibrionia bacterium]|nr:hypothetical protein [Chitinivibrionia bacterium]